MKFAIPFLIVLSLLLTVRCGSDNPATSTPSTAPTITSVNPDRLSRGERVVPVTIRGTNLQGVGSVSFGSDMTIHGWRSISATQLDVDISVGRGAVSGARSISITAQGGSTTSAAIFTVLDNQTPMAVFNITPKDGTENDTFEFDASGSTDDGRITEYAWEFSDNKKETGKIVTRKFAPGTYQVTLTVKDNNGTDSNNTKSLDVEKFTEIECTKWIPNHGTLYGTVIAVEPGNNAIVRLDRNGSTCKNSAYLCGDMRDAQVDFCFFGVITEIADRGNDVFRVKNSCPYRWPPKIGHRVFLFHKRCDKNGCP